MNFVDYNGQLLTFHLNGSGYLVQNTYNYGGGVVVNNSVIRTGGRAWGYVACFFDGYRLNVAYPHNDGSGGYVSYYDGSWHERDGGTF